MENNIVVKNYENDFSEFQLHLEEFELTQANLEEITNLEVSALHQVLIQEHSSDEESEKLRVTRKRKRQIIDSESENDSVENFVMDNLPSTSNNYSKWKDPIRHPARVIPFTEPTGMKLPFSAVFNQADPANFYALLVPDSLFEIIADETNLFATQSLLGNDIRPSLRSHSWQPTDKDEMKRFFGLILFMGLVKLPAINYYWSTDDIMGQTFPRTVMNRNRFEILLQYLHFADNESSNPNDVIGEIRFLVNLLNKNFKAYYSPKEEVCVDESMIPFRGRLSFRQYNKSKRHKYGIKLFKVCTNPGYTINVQIYSGKNFDTVSNTPTKVVLSLCEELLNKGHTIATDNWYTSLELAYELLKNSASGDYQKKQTALAQKSCKDQTKTRGICSTRERRWHYSA